jgi:hypothetical protein
MGGIIDHAALVHARRPAPDARAPAKAAAEREIA